jgi:hypothetical protein
MLPTTGRPVKCPAIVVTAFSNDDASPKLISGARGKPLFYRAFTATDFFLASTGTPFICCLLRSEETFNQSEIPPKFRKHIAKISVSACKFDSVRPRILMTLSVAAGTMAFEFDVLT